MRRADIEVPNLPVDMDSWGRSACYPRRTFYPLSDGPPTRDHRITIADFRLCSTCQSRSQAGLCYCTRRTISDRSEPTHAGPPDHYSRLSSLLDVSVSQSSGLMLLHSSNDFRPF